MNDSGSSGVIPPTERNVDGAHRRLDIRRVIADPHQRINIQGSIDQDREQNAQHSAVNENALDRQATLHIPLL